jgi:hypothetical protein
VGDGPRPDQARGDAEDESARDREGRCAGGERSEQGLSGVRRHEGEGDDEREDEAEGAFEDGDGPAREIEERVEEVGQVIEAHDPERRRDDEDPDRVEDEDGRAEERARERDVERRGRSPEARERPREDADRGEDVDELPELELGGGDEELGVGRLEEGEVERAEAYLLDDGCL